MAALCTTGPTAPGNRRTDLADVGLFIVGFASVFTLHGADPDAQTELVRRAG